VETSLYESVKRFLEQLGYTVKGEVRHCDIVGLRDGDPAVGVIGELKLAFNLELRAGAGTGEAERAADAGRTEGDWQAPSGRRSACV